jgi:hypothetical protein
MVCLVGYPFSLSHLASNLLLPTWWSTPTDTDLQNRAGH